MNFPVYTSMPYPVQQQIQQRQDMQNQQLMQQQVSQQVQQQPVLSPASRVVVSREEAIATPADFSGALMVFPDITNNCVYIKRWNVQSGAAEFMDFVSVMAMVPQMPAQQASQQEQPPLFASVQDFEDLKMLVENQQQQIILLQQKAEQRPAEKPNGKAGKKNDAE